MIIVTGVDILIFEYGYLPIFGRYSGEVIISIY